MTNNRAMFAVWGAVIILTGCSPDAMLFQDELVDGPYRLRMLADPSQTHICYARANGGCDLRIPGRVFAIANDEDFVAAAVRPHDAPAEKLFYYIVRDFDGPRADLARAVRGPFEHDAFVREMREHGVPKPNLIEPRR